MTKYKFGWSRDAAVPCHKLDEFMDELDALCKRYGIGFEMEGVGDGYGKLVPTSYTSGDFNMFVAHTEDYAGGVDWLDEAKARYENLEKQQSERYERQRAEQREIDERITFERLKAKFSVTK